MTNIWVDYFKAIGIILVVYGHSARGLHAAHLPFDQDMFMAFDAAIYSFHMPLFFFASGLFFVESIKKRGFALFFASKLDSLFYLYVVWSLIQGSLSVLLSGVANERLGWLDVSTFLWAPRAQFWFLYVLFLVSVVAAAAWQLPERLRRPAILALGLGCYGASFWLLPIPVVTPLCKHLIYFCMGLFFMPMSAWLQKRHRQLLMTFAVPFFVMQLGVALLAVHGGVLSPFLQLAVGCVSIAFMAALAMFLADKRISWLHYVGQHSLVIYLLHILAASGTRIVLAKLGHISSIPVHLVVGVLAGLLVPLFTERLLTKLRVTWPLQTPWALEVWLAQRKSHGAPSP
jgi:fucose 4-O-acetylase-like acetyltransferase